MLEDLLYLNLLIIVYKAINKISPIYFHEFFTPNSSVHRFGTRQATRGDLFISLKRTTLYGLKLYNTLTLNYGMLSRFSHALLVLLLPLGQNWEPFYRFLYLASRKFVSSIWPNYCLSYVVRVFFLFWYYLNYCSLLVGGLLLD